MNKAFLSFTDSSNFKVASHDPVLWYHSVEEKFKPALNMPGDFLQYSSTIGLL